MFQMRYIDFNLNELNGYNMHPIGITGLSTEKVQYKEYQDESKIVYLPESTTKIIQIIIGIFLYYGLSIYPTMIGAL